MTIKQAISFAGAVLLSVSCAAAQGSAVAKPGSALPGPTITAEAASVGAPTATIGHPEPEEAPPHSPQSQARSHHWLRKGIIVVAALLGVVAVWAYEHNNCHCRPSRALGT